MTHLTFEPKPPGGGRAGFASLSLMRQATERIGIMEKTTNTYTTRDEAIEQGILPMLGDFTDGFDVEGLAGALIQAGVCPGPGKYLKYRYWVEVPGGEDNIGAVLAEHARDAS